MSADPVPPPPARRPRNNLGKRLRKRGFDETTYNRATGYFSVRCSQCAALVINGVACHELGCPNNKKE